MKVIICNTPWGRYAIPLEVVAECRADYYAIEVDGHDKDSKEYKDEVAYVMNDDYEGIDWLLNNSDWHDWDAWSQKVRDDVLVTEEDFWRSSDSFEIVENDSLG